MEQTLTGSIQNCGHAESGTIVHSRGKSLVVDIHCHFAVGTAEARVREAVSDMPLSMPYTSAASQQVNIAQFAAIGSRLNGVQERLEDMDRLGIDVQAISPSPGQYFYFTEPELGRELSHMVNDGIAEAVASHPDRLVGLGNVPLQNTEMAVAELRRCIKELGFRGVEINTNVNGRELADPAFRPFFAAAQELGALIFVHPLGFTHGERLTEHYLNNIIGNPLESTLALSHLIFGGVLDALPGLKLCVAHGGGYLPSYWGRMDHAWRVRPECRVTCAHQPSHYLRQIWVDTLVFDREQLNALVRTHGADRLCLGTDYPFDMSEPDPVGFHDDLDGPTRAKILGLNAAALLGLAD
ncbi:amidohydrolase family protein [Sphingobium xenophagum]|uniref:amidohydrolase family protein n=1 Tax=Sphingobium xenophagum TaxID=121428 RepID=UPI00286B1E75|nr:amidohydrolase family protein [Sphingobium xenophagum]